MNDKVKVELIVVFVDGVLFFFCEEIEWVYMGGGGYD